MTDAGHERAADGSLATTSPSPVEGLQSLLRCGFSGRRLWSQQGRLCTLYYQRCWLGVSDIVLVYGSDDAEAYRMSVNEIGLAEVDPVTCAERPDLKEEVVGTVTAVVAAVHRWPTPDAWAPFFPPARS